MARYDVHDRYGGKIGELRESPSVDVGGLVMLVLFLTFGLVWLAWKALVLCWRYPKIAIPVFAAVLLVGVIGGVGQPFPTRSLGVRSADVRPVQPRDVEIGTLAPGDDDGPGVLVAQPPVRRTLDEVAQAYSDAEEAERRFHGWGWSGNVYREFVRPAGIRLDPSDPDYARVGIHRFAGPAEAEAALEFIADDTADGAGGQRASSSLGDGAVVLHGSNESGNWVICVVRRHRDVFSVGVSSPAGDPSADAVALVRIVLAR